MEALNSSSTRRALWNKGRLTGQKPIETARDLGDSDDASDVIESPRVGTVQSGNRQQASGMSSDATSSAGHLHGEPRNLASDLRDSGRPFARDGRANQSLTGHGPLSGRLPASSGRSPML
jgi:hypothetical protein